MITEAVQRGLLIGSGAVILALGALGVVQRVQLAESRAALATEKAAHADDITRMANAALALADQRRRHDEQVQHEQETHDAEQVAKEQLLERRVADLAASHSSLQQRAAALAAAARGPAAGPAAQCPCEAASTTADLLAGVLGRLDSAAGDIALYADQLLITGERCYADAESVAAPLQETAP
jgi:hypothetical protein